MDCTEPMDEVNRRLEFDCLQWSTGDEVDCILNLERAVNEVKVKKWFGIKPFPRLEGKVEAGIVIISSVHFFYNYIWLTKSSTSRGFMELWESRSRCMRYENDQEFTSSLNLAVDRLYLSWNLP